MADKFRATSSQKRMAIVRVTIAIILGLTFSWALYALLNIFNTSPTGVIMFSFLVIAPFCFSALIAYIADPFFIKEIHFYTKTALIFMVAITIASAFILQEGILCILMLLPLWVPLSLAGSAFTYKVRKNYRKSRTYCMALLIIPFIAVPIENQINITPQNHTVSREIIVNASANKIWPLLRGIENVSANEGQWNITQNIMQVPRPIGAKLIGSGIGAQRLAKWERDIGFQEEITQWEKHKHIGWRFIFKDLHKWDFQDEHLMPNSQYFQVKSGGYTLTALSDGRSRLSLNTQYWIKVPFGSYAAIWGEFLLGDIHDNLLHLIKERAEQ